MCLLGLVEIRQIVLKTSSQIDFCDLFRPHVTLNFDLLTPKTDRFGHLHHEPLVPIGVNINSFVLKISRSQVW